MRVQPSPFLTKNKKIIRGLVEELSQDFPFVSVLGADTRGTRYQVSRTGVSIKESSWAERGFVCRVYHSGVYSEYSFNDTRDMAAVAEAVRRTVREKETLSEEIPCLGYPSPEEEEELCRSWQAEVEEHPEQRGSEAILKELSAAMEEGIRLWEDLIDMRLIYEFAQVSKLFLSTRRDLEQSYLWSQGYIYPIGRREGKVKYSYRAFSGMKGAELLDEMLSQSAPAVEDLKELFRAEKVIPGEYDIICDPAMAGLIAHEAFGHGVEMDMFVKKRAKAAEYIGKPVASPKVEMHDGAGAARQVSSYLFDDEGTLGGDTLIIREGVLQEGISDTLSASKLGTGPTGNGKRESFQRKAYSRMTNTYFSPGEDSLEEMIRSVEKGYLLESYTCGMEDPKNWGIQCVALKGKEIAEGRLTGKVIAPVYLTGFVPDLLQSISMVSGDFQLFGSGACGKGYKEYVKTSSGGPYIKTKGRLA